MEDLKTEFEPKPQSDDTMPQRTENVKPKIPEKIPHNDAGTIPLQDMKKTYSQQLQASVEDGADDEHDGAEMAIMGFTQIEVPGKQSKPKTILDELLPERNSSIPPPAVAETDPEEAFTLVTAPAEIQDDMQPAKRAKGRDQAQEQHLHRQIQDLQLRLESMKARAEIAEEKSDLLGQRNADLKKRMESAVDADETLKDAAALIRETERLEDENKLLTEQLRDAQSHIFSLQPYRKDLTKEEVGRVSVL
jgi:hypothetical protein